ncbi:cation transporter p-type ATPase a CtpA domain protein [Mycobacterium ulcerans str. Harvey]|uniref:Cation transporter p-type ATPase a CtpA domain protein n=1 Tax=Mycobacterium ulcerans str. Harvey TaxID=1299332 RepID=A0ABN0QMC4_MYCUL|nr:cation transporter p-type ATPase a CtpA domain protein [Mycobacterium ulcerans str. Harvey]
MERDQQVQRFQLGITGMSCFACARKVQSTLNKVPGFGHR